MNRFKRYWKQCAATIDVVRIPSYREIAPSGTTFFNPTDKIDLREKILKAIEHCSHPDMQSYRDRLKLFTPDNFVSRLRMIYLAK